jgi:hypothetical protein
MQQALHSGSASSRAVAAYWYTPSAILELSEKKDISLQLVEKDRIQL